MGILGSAIGGAIGIGASIFGGIKASEAMNNVRNSYEKEKQENENWYNRRYNEDATQRADAQRVLTLTQEAIKERNKEAQASAAVMGGTEESVAAARAQNNQALAETASQIAAAGERRKEKVEEQYMKSKQSLTENLRDLEKARAENITKAAAGVADASSKLGEYF